MCQALGKLRVEAVAAHQSLQCGGVGVSAHFTASSAGDSVSAPASLPSATQRVVHYCLVAAGIHSVESHSYMVALLSGVPSICGCWLSSGDSHCSFLDQRKVRPSTQEEQERIYSAYDLTR